MEPNILYSISYGMYIVSSFKGDFLNGQIANTVFQITSQPQTIAVSINKENLTHEYIKASGYFCVSVLEQDTPLSFIGKFGFKSGKTEDKFKDTRFEKTSPGCPVVLDYSIGYLLAKIVNQFDCGTHTLFLGEIIQTKVLKEARPMTYDYYHQVKRGTTPQTAPTFLKEEAPKTEIVKMQKYRCVICNYIYDPQIGDPDSGIPAGTPFEKLPDNWVCPVCGAGKSEFVIES